MVIAFFNGLKSYLNSKPFVCDVVVEFRRPVSDEKYKEWESANRIQLPVDIKEFYMTTDGLYFCWHNVYGASSEGKTIIGQIAINSLEFLKKTDYMIDKGDEAERRGSKDDELDQFFPELRDSVVPITHIFLLEKCLGSGYVVLGYYGENSAIFYIDRDGCMYRICETFTQYVRLAVAHLGLIDWHAWYTPTKPSAQAMQYAALFTPERMYVASKGMRLGNETNPVSYPTTKINVKKLSLLDATNRNDRSSYANRSVPLAMAGKRGR